MGETHFSSAQAVPTSVLGSRMSLSKSLSSKNLPPQHWTQPAGGQGILSWPCREARSKDDPIWVLMEEKGLTVSSAHPGP